MTYSPYLGRFLEEDPIGFEGGDDNLYRFVGNDPTNATDPTGQYLIAKNADEAQKFLRTMERFGLKNREGLTHTLPSGAVLIFTTSSDWESLFQYADARWAKVFDEKFMNDPKTHEAWLQMAQERNAFLFAAGATGQATWRKTALSVEYKDKQWSYNKIDLSPEDRKTLSDCSFLSDTVLIDLGGEGRYRSRRGRAVLNIRNRAKISCPKAALLSRCG